MLVQMDEIKIPYLFILTPPMEDKINKHKDYFKEHNAFIHAIVISEKSNMLVDGYIDYIIAREQGFTEIDCELIAIKRRKKSNRSINSKRKRNIRCNLMKDFNNKCAICGCDLQADNQEERETFVTIDHIYPLSKGGKNHLSNLQPTCWYCNHVKANLLPEEFENFYSGSLKIS